MKESIKFSIEFPGGMDEKQIKAILPGFILVGERKKVNPQASNVAEIDVDTWQFTDLENGNIGVNGHWKKRLL